jgi:DNA-binding transcriptional ArsR family regulator
MRAKEEYRDRDETEVAVLDALADRTETGTTVFDLRALVEEDIDTLEDALAELNEDGLIEVTEQGGRTMIFAKDHAIGNGTNTDDGGTDFFEEIRRRFPF